MSNLEMAHEMGRRVGLSRRLSREIFLMALNCALKLGQPKADMVLVAKAIKYASDNKDQLKPQWRFSQSM